MTYPFTPEVLDAMPEELAELFRDLEDTLLEEICSRLEIAGNLNEVTVQDIRALRSHGISLDDIQKAISETSGTGMDKLNQLMDDVVDRNQAYYTEAIDLARVTAPAVMVGSADIDLIRKQTENEFRNLTRSMGFLVDNGKRMLEPAKAYQWALDSTEMQIQSGAISYSEAIKRSILQLADSGIKVVSYESGHVDQIDVAARRAVLTGINQLNQKYREQAMEVLETDLVEVSAHIGARDIDGPLGWENHKKWQGKVYRWAIKPASSTGLYPDFETTCGVGSVTGIGGANCRHSYWPFIEDVSARTYTDEQLEHIDDGHGCEFEGKTYSAYEATQKQRQVERTIRKWERRKKALKASGQDTTDVDVRLQRLKKKYTDFSKAANLSEKPERMRALY